MSGYRHKCHLSCDLNAQITCHDKHLHDTKPSLLNEAVPWVSSLQNPPCWMRLFPEYSAYKTLPAEWGCSLSIQPTKPSLLNEPAPWAMSLQNPHCSMSLLIEHRAYKISQFIMFKPYRSAVSIVLTMSIGWQCIYRSVASTVLTESKGWQCTYPSVVSVPLRPAVAPRTLYRPLVNIQHMIYTWYEKLTLPETIYHI